MPTTNVCIDCAREHKRRQTFNVEEVKYPYLHSIDQIDFEWFYILEDGVEPDWETSWLPRNEEEERMINYLDEKENLNDDKIDDDT